MKTILLGACVLALLPPASAQSPNIVINGDFETGTSNAFWGTPGWYNRGKGLNQGANARSDKNVITTGNYSAGVVDRYDAAKSEYIGLAHSQITKHLIQPGDIYTLSFSWHPFDSYWQRNRDTVRFVVYATKDDNLGGEVVWSAVVTSDFFQQPLGSVKTVVQELPPVTDAAVGKKLMFTFHGIDTVDSVTGNPHFARVDDIHITVATKKKTP